MNLAVVITVYRLKFHVLNFPFSNLNGKPKSIDTNGDDRKERPLDAVAKEVGYTPAYFSRLFKRVTGKSYIEMLTKYRLGYARNLLANGFSVADACYSSGFGSLTAFQDAFRKKYNTSPSTYKKNANSKSVNT